MLSATADTSLDCVAASLHRTRGRRESVLVSASGERRMGAGKRSYPIAALRNGYAGFLEGPSRVRPEDPARTSSSVTQRGAPRGEDGTRNRVRTRSARQGRAPGGKGPLV